MAQLPFNGASHRCNHAHTCVTFDDRWSSGRGMHHVRILANWEMSLSEFSRIRLLARGGFWRGWCRPEMRGGRICGGDAGGWRRGSDIYCCIPVSGADRRGAGRRRSQRTPDKLLRRSPLGRGIDLGTRRKERTMERVTGHSRRIALEAARRSIEGCILSLVGIRRGCRGVRCGCLEGWGRRGTVALTPTLSRGERENMCRLPSPRPSPRGERGKVRRLPSPGPPPKGRGGRGGGLARVTQRLL